MHGMLVEPATRFTLSKSMISLKPLLIVGLFFYCDAHGATFSAAQKAFEEKDYAQAYSQFLTLRDDMESKSNASDQAAASYYLGVMNQQGWGVIADAEKAAHFYQIAAEQGHLRALHNLAGLYHRGRGVAQDLEQALALYRRAAGLGSAKAAHRLGLIYFQGDGVARDFVLARQWWQKAFNGGEADSGYNLGILYKRGLGISRDQGRALEIWESAARLGSGHAQNAVGSALLNGDGVAHDPVQAYAWFRQAAQAGIAVASTNAELVWESLPPLAKESALAEAEKLQQDIAH